MKLNAILFLALFAALSAIELDLIRPISESERFERMFFERRFAQHKNLNSFLKSHHLKTAFLAKHKNTIKKYWESYSRKFKRYQALNEDQISIQNYVPVIQQNSFNTRVGIGTPPQSFWVQLDTGSSDLVIPSVDCHTNYCNESETFNSSASSTYQPSNGTFDNNYGQGTNEPTGISGIVGFDNVDFNGLLLKNFKFGLVLHSYNNSSPYPSMSGILGLGYPSNSGFGSYSVIQTLFDEGLIERRAFSFYFTKRPNSQGSKLILGGVNNNYFKSPLSYFKVTHEVWYQFDMDGFLVNGQLVQYNTAILDTGTSTLVVPFPTFNALNSLIGYVHPYCIGVENLPDVIVVIQGQKFPLSYSDYIAIFEGQCQNGFSGETTGPVILGDLFLQRYYAFYDYGKGIIGLAEAVQN